MVSARYTRQWARFLVRLLLLGQQILVGVAQVSDKPPEAFVNWVWVILPGSTLAMSLLVDWRVQNGLAGLDVENGVQELDVEHGVRELDVVHAAVFELTGSEI